MVSNPISNTRIILKLELLFNDLNIWGVVCEGSGEYMCDNVKENGTKIFDCGVVFRYGI